MKITSDSNRKAQEYCECSKLTGKQAVNQKLNINVNVYYDVLIIDK